MMRVNRSLSCLFAVLLSVSCGGGDSGTGPGSNNNHPPTPEPTAVGSPVGSSTSKTIGAGGGSVASDDGLFALTIPAGALASDTLITVQAITNNAWGGIGGGYRLTPNGLTFSIPVQLAFKVAPEDLVGSAAALLDVAVQDDAGLWYILKNTAYDDASGTLSSTTTHFSDYSSVEGLQIRPASASLATLGTLDLHVKYCHQETITDPADNLTALAYNCDEELAPVGTFSNWSVNGVKGGNGAVGTVTATVGNTARYKAPPSVPPGNPVAVSVEAKGRRGKTLLVSNITIGASWYGTVVIEQGTAKSEAHVFWALTASYQGIETYEPSGTVHYTPDTDYGPSCSFVSMDPRDAPITPDPFQGAMFIDRNSDPDKAYGFGTVAVIATTCFTCDGWSSPDCSEAPLPGWFAADSLAVSADGLTITRTWTDDSLPPVTTTVIFTQGTPPAAFLAKR